VDWIDLAHDGTDARGHGPGSSKCHDESSGCVKWREITWLAEYIQLVNSCIYISFFKSGICTEIYHLPTLRKFNVSLKWNVLFKQRHTLHIYIYIRMHICSVFQFQCIAKSNEYPKLICRSGDRASWKILIIKPTRCTNFSNLCFGHFLCPSPRVFLLYTQQWYMSYRFADSLRAASGRNYSSVLMLLASCQQTCMTHTNAVCTVKKTPWWWTEEMSETCRVLFEKWMWKISASSWFYYKNPKLTKNARVWKPLVQAAINWLNRLHHNRIGNAHTLKHWGEFLLTMFTMEKQ